MSDGPGEWVLQGDERVLAQVGALIDARAYEQGLRLVGHYLVSNPGDVEALCLAARAEIGRENPKQAYDFATRAAALGPMLEWPQRLIAISLGQLGRFTDAIQAAQEAVRLAPMHWQPHYQLAAAQYHQPGRADAALGSIAEALRLAPDEPSVHRLAGMIQGATGQPRLARQSLRRALALDPHDAVARHELARLSLRRGHLSEAARGFGAAIALDPSLSVGVRNLDLVIARLLRAVVLVCFACSVLLLSAEEPQSVRVLIASMATLASGGLLGWFWRRAGSALNAYLKALPHRQPLSVCW